MIGSPYYLNNSSNHHTTSILIATWLKDPKRKLPAGAREDGLHTLLGVYISILKNWYPNKPTLAIGETSKPLVPQLLVSCLGARWPNPQKSHH